MKAFLVLFLVTISSYSHASWMGTKCSNSDGTVKWESGFSEDHVSLKYANFVEGVLTLEPHEVQMKLSKEIVIREQEVNECHYRAKNRVYATRVKITASEKNPEVLRSYFPENKVVTEVICTTVVTSTLPCDLEKGK